ncbi:HAD family hydrolase [candidate division KSB1 bacterium]|nr:HAD family hydrolase [candidate division KSB1 bacterium]
MAALKAILFDVYGTLIDIRTDEHRDDRFEALSRFLEYRQVAIPPRELKELYFDQINQQLARSRETNPEVDVASAFSHILRERCWANDHYLAMVLTQLYRSLTRERFALFADTFWTLSEFRKAYRLGAVSDAQRLFCMPELQVLRLHHFFDAVVISSDYGFRKPDPRMFHIALAVLDLEPEQAAYIGNKYETDCLGARRAGLACVGLIHQSDQDTSHYSEAEQPDFVAENLRQALNQIKNWESLANQNRK